MRYRAIPAEQVIHRRREFASDPEDPEAVTAPVKTSIVWCARRTRPPSLR